MAAIGDRRHDRYKGAATLGGLRALSRYRRCEPDGEISSPRGAARGVPRQTTPGLSFGASSKRRQCDDGQRGTSKSRRSPSRRPLLQRSGSTGSNRSYRRDRPSRGRRFVQCRPTVRKPSACAACHVKGDPAANYPAITSQHPVTSRSSCETLKKADVRTTQTASCGALPRNLAPEILPPLPRMPAAYHVKNGASHER